MLSNVPYGGKKKNSYCLLHAMTWVLTLKVLGWQIWCVRKWCRVQPWVTGVDSDHTDVLIPEEEENTEWARGWTWKWWQWEKHWSRQLKASFPGLPAMRKAKPAKSFRPSRPKTLASSYFQLPTPHAQTTQENCLSPFILVPFGYTSVYAKPLPNSLPSSCHCVLAAAFWGLLGRQAGGDGDRVLVGCLDSETAVISTWFLGGLNSALTPFLGKC